MPRVLAYTSPARGHLFPIVPILSELRDRGHQVALRTLAAEVERMRTLGFDAEPVDPAVEAVQHDDFRARTARGGLQRSIATFASRAEHDGADLGQALAAIQPDAVLVDVNSWGALAAAEAWGGPWAAFCPYPLPLPSRDAPPFGPGLAPATGPAGRARDRLLKPLFWGTFSRMMLPPLNRIRGRAGLRPLTGIEEMFARLPLLLYLTAEPFEYPRTDWPGNVEMVGPCAWEPPAQTPEWLARVDRPLVLVTTSSEFQDDGRLVATALEALAGEDVQVVATLPAAAPRDLRVPPNARVERWIAHGPLLDRAACAVTHGGMGATQKALGRGVPVCAVPFGRDQLEVARRVEVAAAGTRLPARRLNASRLRAKVAEATECGPGARRIADAFAAAGGASAAADAFEARLPVATGSA